MTDPTELEAEIARVALAMAKADGWDGSVGGTLLPFDILAGPMLTPAGGNILPPPAAISLPTRRYVMLPVPRLGRR